MQTSIELSVQNGGVVVCHTRLLVGLHSCNVLTQLLLASLVAIVDGQLDRLLVLDLQHLILLLQLGQSVVHGRGLHIQVPHVLLLLHLILH